MLKTSALLATAIFVLCDSAAIIEKDKRCSIKDEGCIRTLFDIIVKKASEDAIPGIPKSDPFVLKDFNLPFLGLFNVTVTEGSIKGFKTCYSTVYKIDLEAGISRIEIICDVFNIEGSYVAESTPPFLALTGGINIHGKGSGIAAIEKLKLNINQAFEVKKNDDGEAFFYIKPEESTYSFAVLGKLTVDGNGLFVGKQDISSVAVNIINEEWKVFINVFGSTVFDKAVEIFNSLSQKIFKDNLAKDFLTDIN